MLKTTSLWKTGVNEQDEKGRTAAHRFALWGLQNKFPSKERMDSVLSAGIDWTIEDKQGLRPLDVMAIAYSHATIADMWPMFVEQAMRDKFDFSALNSGGKSILHLACFTSREDISAGLLMKRRIPILDILMVMEKLQAEGLKIAINFDVVSASGSTPLAYLLNHMELDAAGRLLDLGVNPALGEEGRKPLDEIAPYLHVFKQLIDAKSGAMSVDEICADMSERDRRFFCKSLEQSSIEEFEQKLEKLTAIKDRIVSRLEAMHSLHIG